MILRLDAFLSRFKELDSTWLLCMIFVLATCLVCSLCKVFMILSPRLKSPLFFPSISAEPSLKDDVAVLQPEPVPEPQMRYHKAPRFNKRRSLGKPRPAEPSYPRYPQPYDAFLVLDIEGTCKLGSDFNYPNEIIEFPVCLLKWEDRTPDGLAAKLKVVDEFRTFVRPTWKPQLSEFCTQLTGITQEQVDNAPPFTQVVQDLEAFLTKNGLIDGATGKRLMRYCWCSDGPFDVRDFIVKQCFISKLEMPIWVQGDVLDVRFVVLQWVYTQRSIGVDEERLRDVTRRSLNISKQLEVLELPTFEGRQHSGIDDARNLAKIVTSLGRRGVVLVPNTIVHPGRRWSWMGKHGQILEEGLT